MVRGLWIGDFLKSLLKVLFVLWVVFTSLLLISNLTGFLDIEFIENKLEVVKGFSPLLVGCLISLILTVDLFLAIPTLSVCILSGFFLGFPQGAFFALFGMFFAGCLGFFLSKYHGEKLIAFILKNETERKEIQDIFERFGGVMILVARSAPLLPEVCSCLAGATGMSFRKFIFFWILGAAPYAAVAAYSGSVSSVENPFPAIIGAITLTVAFALVGLITKKKFKIYKSPEKVV